MKKEQVLLILTILFSISSGKSNQNKTKNEEISFIQTEKNVLHNSIVTSVSRPKLPGISLKRANHVSEGPKTKSNFGSETLDELKGAGYGFILDLVWSSVGSILTDKIGVDPENCIMRYLGWGGYGDSIEKAFDDIENSLNLIQDDVNELDKKLTNYYYEFFDNERNDKFSEVTSGANEVILNIGEIIAKYNDGEQELSEEDLKILAHYLDDWAAKHLSDFDDYLNLIQNPFRIGETYKDHYDNLARELMKEKKKMDYNLENI